MATSPTWSTWGRGKASGRSSASGPSRASGPGKALAPMLAIGLTVVGLIAINLGLTRIVGVPGLLSLLTGSGSVRVLDRSLPTRISIPSLSLRATVTEVGLAADGSIAAPGGDPAETAGWYEHGPTPGERGSAVIVGHVDTAGRPAVFARLAQLRQDRLIEISRQDRRIATFRVDSVETFGKTQFPATRVFRPDGHARLVLITCGGAWIGGETGYADNIIVFATLT